MKERERRGEKKGNKEELEKERKEMNNQTIKKHQFLTTNSIETPYPTKPKTNTNKQTKANEQTKRQSSPATPRTRRGEGRIGRHTSGEANPGASWHLVLIAVSNRYANQVISRKRPN